MSVAAGAENTRGRLLAAAEALIAERGVAPLSLREVSRAAGARNVNATQYWFTDRAGLLAALLAKHRPAVEAHRHRLLNVIDSDSGASLYDLAAALVIPLGAKLDEGVPGAGYLRTVADLLSQPSPSLAPLDLDDPTASLVRWSALIGPRLDSEAVAMHRRFLAIRFVATELALRSQRREHDSQELFVSQLVDVTTGLLAAPASKQTKRLRASRRRSPSGVRR